MQLAKWFDMPAGTTGALTCIEIIGFKLLRIENHKGLQSFDNKKITFNTLNQALLTITGENMLIKTLDANIATIEGDFVDMSYDKQGDG